MKNVYDMVTCEFINDEQAHTADTATSIEPVDTFVQLQLVESESTGNTPRLPADLAYRIFFSD